jgi:hypothetical protein
VHEDLTGRRKFHVGKNRGQKSKPAAPAESRTKNKTIEFMSGKNGNRILVARAAPATKYETLSRNSSSRNDLTTKNRDEDEATKKNITQHSST